MFRLLFLTGDIFCMEQKSKKSDAIASKGNTLT